MDYLSELFEYTKRNDTANANRAIMRELGNILVKSKQDFVDLLMYSGIPATMDMSDSELIFLFIDQIHYNRRLMVGTAFLTAKHNCTKGFDGEEEIDDPSIKSAYRAMYEYYGTQDYPDLSTEEFYNAEGDESDESDSGNSKNDRKIAKAAAKAARASSGLGAALFGALGKGADLASKITDNQRLKKYGATDLAMRKQEAKNDLVKSVLAQRQAQVERSRNSAAEKSKQVKTIAIAGVVIVGLGTLAIVLLSSFGKKTAAS